ncbi:MAG TPA: hypothetical protein VIK78_03280 [Ruminiclostridium sp.]
MAEVTVEVLNIRVEHNTADIADIKTTVKEQGLAIGVMNIGYIKTEIYIKNIQDGQIEIMATAKETAKETKKYQEDTLIALQAIKDEKWKAWKDLHMVWKVSIIGVIATLLGSYVWGSVLAFMKNWGE